MKRKLKDLCKKITDFYVHLRAKTTGYPFKFHNGLKAKLYHIANRKVAIVKKLCEIHQMIFNYDSLRYCYVIETEVQNKKMYLAYLPGVLAKEWIIERVRDKPYNPIGVMLVVFENTIYTGYQIEVLLDAINNNCEPTIAAVLGHSKT